MASQVGRWRKYRRRTIRRARAAGKITRAEYERRMAELEAAAAFFRSRHPERPSISAYRKAIAGPGPSREGAPYGVGKEG